MRFVAYVAAACLLLGASVSFAGTGPDQWPAAAKEGPVLVQLVDGREVEAVGPVTGDDRMLIFRLTDNTLVSMKTSSVARITAVRVPRPALPQSATRTHVAPIADRAGSPRTFKNTDLPEPLESQSAPPADEPTAVTDPESQATEEPAGLVDRNGHNEKWWRDRVSGLNAELAATESEIERLESDVRKAKVRVGGKLPDAGSGERSLNDVLVELEVARTRRNGLKAEIDGLSEEVRRAGAMPGWLR